VHAGNSLAQRTGQLERRFMHVERVEDAGLEHLAEPLSGDGFDHLTAPVYIAAVLPLVARIEHQRRLGRGDDARLAFLLRKAVVRLVKEDPMRAAD
jgi:hypothetical protein